MSIELYTHRLVHLRIGTAEHTELVKDVSRLYQGNIWRHTTVTYTPKNPRVTEPTITINISILC